MAQKWKRIQSILPYTARVETPLTVWKDIGTGKLDSMKALIEKKYKILGDLAFMSQWEEYFGGTNDTGKQKKEKTKRKTKQFVDIITSLANGMDCQFQYIPIGEVLRQCWAVRLLCYLYFLVRLTPYDIISIFVCGMISALD